MARIATLTEIETRWSLCDLFDAHEALDVHQEAQQWAAENPKGK